MGWLTPIPSRSLSRSKNSLAEIDTNLPTQPAKDIKPSAPLIKSSSRGENRNVPIWVLSDSEDDDDVAVLADDKVPAAMRKKSNRANPVEVSDDDDEDRPSSSRAGPSSSLPVWAKKLKKSLDRPAPRVPKKEDLPPAATPVTSSATAAGEAPSSINRDGQASSPQDAIPAATITSTFEIKPSLAAAPSGPSAIRPPKTGITGEPMSDVLRAAKLQAEISEVIAQIAIRRAASVDVDIYLDALDARLIELNTIMHKPADRGDIEYRAANSALLERFPQIRPFADLFTANLVRQYQRNLGDDFSIATIRDIIRRKTGYTPPADYQLPLELTSAVGSASIPENTLAAFAPDASNTAGPSNQPDVKPIPSLPGFVSSQFPLPAPKKVVSLPGDVNDSDDDNELPPDSDPKARFRREDPLQQDIQDYFADTVAGWEDDADIDKALRQLGLDSIEDTFSDLTIRLMPHQCLGVAWMLTKEKTKRYRGGLLCDAMGLGKTVQMIATIVGNKSQDKKVKTTLVVAPLALLSQWKAEIESKTTPGLMKVVIHHGTGKVKDAKRLRQYDVVLTTYGTLVAEFGNEDQADKPKKKKKKRPARGLDNFIDDDEESEEEIEVRRKGPLFKIRWYRVVLDEAHVIRNRHTRMAKAACDLDAIMRWSLTGTLIVNTLDDLHTQLKFTGISMCRDWAHYNNHIGKQQKKKPRLATQRAQAILKGCMMRRNKESTLNGRRLLELPPKATELEELDFSLEERQIYNAVETRMQIRFTKYYREGTVLKHMSCILVMLLRLRQLCAHPWLIRRNPGDPAHPNDFTVADADLFANMAPPKANDPQELEQAIEVMGQAWVDEVVERLHERSDKLANAAKRDDDAEKEMECAICLDMLQEEVIVNCKHSFCRACISEIFTNPPREQDNMTDAQVQHGARKCPMCRAVIEKDKVFSAVAFLPPAEEEEDRQEGSSPGGPSLDRKGKRRMDEVDEPVDEKPDIKRLAMDIEKECGKGKGKEMPVEEDEDMDIRVLPSTKMKRLLALVQQYVSEPGIKVIVFSQFTSFLELASDYLLSERIAHEVYIGPMNLEAREEAVRNFTAPIVNAASPRVMLISLKCGGVGLNLTAASKVISLDLAWNTPTEEQAFDRAHRIGQTRPVEVRRLVIANSVEQRILRLQESKKALADGAMGEGAGGKLGRLTVGDLVKLFNINANDI